MSCRLSIGLAAGVAALLEVAGPTKLVLVDRGLARAAARGAGYSGSLNLTLKEARDLGAAIGCDFYLTGDAHSSLAGDHIRLDTKPVVITNYTPMERKY